MTVFEPPFRAANKEEAPLLAELVNYAGEGLPLYLWEKFAEPGESAWEVGSKRAAREESDFSYRNAVIIEHQDKAAGCLIGYKIPDPPEPIPPDLPALFKPLQELEDHAPATWYINVLAVMPAFRNKGLGSQLLTFAEKIGQNHAAQGMSIIVSDANAGARRLYERHGYREKASRPMVKEDWQNEGENWVLLTKGF